MADIHEIHVRRKSKFGDPRAADVKAEIRRTLGIDTHIDTTTVYRIEGPTEDQAKILANKVFVDPIVEDGIVNPDPPTRHHYQIVHKDGSVSVHDNTDPTIEVSYKPGVTDPVAQNIIKAGNDLGMDIKGARVSTIYEFGDVDQEQADIIADRLLVNKTVQENLKTKPESLVITGERGPITVIPIREMDEESLIDLSKDKLFQNLEEMKIIQKYFKELGRDPRDAELEAIAARNSEHCNHKTFNAKVIVNGVEKKPLFARIKETSRRYFGEDIATAFDDNSGGMHFYDGQVVLVKWETHNSPSALEPKGGAATGSGGVFRDIMGTGQGAKVIISADVFAVAPPDTDPSIMPPGTIAPDSLLRGVVSGVRDYGNPMGIPTPNGSVHFHEDFRAKPTVLVGAYGITPEEYSHKGEPQVGDRVVVIGGRTGRDGIHGATFSSAEMTERTATVNSTAVQIGNPIEEKKVGDLILAARDAGFIRALTDCGAAGFSSAIGEIGENVGINVDISKAPLKYEGLAPWEIWLSESQERMVLAVAPENMEDFQKLAKRFNVEATDLGFFDGENKMKVFYGEEPVVDLDYDFLKHGFPQLVMEAKYEQEVFEEKEIAMPSTVEEWGEEFKKVLSHGNVCSKLPIVEQYDTTVQGGSVLSPFGGEKNDAPNDAAVVQPMLDKPYGVIVSHGMNPILNRIDPRRGALWAATEAVSNLVAAGGDYREMVLCGNYISPVPDAQYMGSLDIQVDAVNEFLDVIKRPVVSGKDSLSSTYKYSDGRKIQSPPVVNISTLGRIPDIEKTMSTDFKTKDSTIVLVGTMHPGMAGSVYLDNHDAVGNDVPAVFLKGLPEVFDVVHNGIDSQKIKACHDISEGGVGAALAEMCFGGECGVELNVEADMRPDLFLFNETAGMFVVEVDSASDADEIFGEVPHVVLGNTTSGKTFIYSANGQELFNLDVESLKAAWERPMRTLFH